MNEMDRPQQALGSIQFAPQSILAKDLQSIFRYSSEDGSSFGIVGSPPGFIGFPKMARISRNCTITEKIDGTNAQIYIKDINKAHHDDRMLGYWYGPDASTWAMYVGSRTRWIKPGDDNFGFAAWAKENFEELKKLGPGQHFGEWWGQGIQRKYGMDRRVFSLFNAHRWSDELGMRPSCCSVVPVLYHGPFATDFVNGTLMTLCAMGSSAAPGFKDPEGIVVYHEASGGYFKKTIMDDAVPKSLAKAA